MIMYQILIVDKNIWYRLHYTLGWNRHWNIFKNCVHKNWNCNKGWEVF